MVSILPSLISREDRQSLLGVGCATVFRIRQGQGISGHIVGKGLVRTAISKGNRLCPSVIGVRPGLRRYGRAKKSRVKGLGRLREGIGFLRKRRVPGVPGTVYRRSPACRRRATRRRQT